MSISVTVGENHIYQHTDIDQYHCWRKFDIPTEYTDAKRWDFPASHYGYTNQRQPLRRAREPMRFHVLVM